MMHVFLQQGKLKYPRGLVLQPCRLQPRLHERLPQRQAHQRHHPCWPPRACWFLVSRGPSPQSGKAQARRSRAQDRSPRDPGSRRNGGAPATAAPQEAGGESLFPSIRLMDGAQVFASFSQCWIPFAHAVLSYLVPGQHLSCSCVATSVSNAFHPLPSPPLQSLKLKLYPNRTNYSYVPLRKEL